ncbi:polysaccharide deacetylase family protein [Pareuzebyella sediminis]|uniref:polysaccharide deacetylase family protein n=1 Tax=Pareuzebyella sediminis TaxID=2607998 RepID=UPI0011EF37A9|nr:polysaccharide deacetylase family protein [Pareuzebyella sediminis]
MRSYLLMAYLSIGQILWGQHQNPSFDAPISKKYGAIVRGDSTQKKLTLIFTGDSFADGAARISRVLRKKRIKAAFFFTGNFYRNPSFAKSIKKLIKDQHYLGAHSDRHLLYCSWEDRDSLLITKNQFVTDLKNNYSEMERFGITKEDAPFFLPPYEWYSDTISKWTYEQHLQLINFTSGTSSNADYTTPSMTNYKTSQDIYNNILDYEEGHGSGLNGFLLLIHIGTDPERKDKFYLRLSALVDELRSRGYIFTGLKEHLAFDRIKL